MNKNLKVIALFLHIIAFNSGTVIMSLVRIGFVKLSLLDITRIGFGKYGNSLFDQEVLNVVREYFQPYAYVALFLFIVFFISALLNGILEGQRGYISGIISQFILSGIAVALYLNMKGKLESITEMTESIDFYYVPIMAWAGLEILALLINIVGIQMLKKEKQGEIQRKTVHRIPASCQKTQVQDSYSDNDTTVFVNYEKSNMELRIGNKNRTCPRCGEKLDGGAFFCGNCGHRVG